MHLKTIYSLNLHHEKVYGSTSILILICLGILVFSIQFLTIFCEKVFFGDLIKNLFLYLPRKKLKGAGAGPSILTSLYLGNLSNKL